MNTKGQVRRTVGIPGSGLYDTELVNPRGPNPAQETATDSRAEQSALALERRYWGKATLALVVIMAVIIIGQAIALGSR